MTQHMLDMVRDLVGDEPGLVLEIGSYIEAQQDHLNMRRAFKRATPYVGIDVNAGPGVDRVVDFLDDKQFSETLAEIGQPRTVLCLYVVEHVWDIRHAVGVLGEMWRRNPESWLILSTHQNQSFHGTEKYGDYWRLTLAGFSRLVGECGIPGVSLFGLHDTSNPADVVAVRQPQSKPWAYSIAPYWVRYQ